MSLEKCRSRSGFRTSQGVNDLDDQHIVEIDRQIADLWVLHAELSELRMQFDSTRPTGRCETLKQLGEAAAQPT